MLLGVAADWTEPALPSTKSNATSWSLLEGFKFNVNDILKDIFDISDPVLDPELILDVTNPLVFPIFLEQFNLNVFIKDLDGSPFTFPFLPSQQPEVNYLLNTGPVAVKNIPLGLFPSQPVQVVFEVPIDRSNLLEASGRLYDEIIRDEKLCLHIRDISLKIRVSTNLNINLNLYDMNDIAVLGDNPCGITITDE
jgi:hypothetical protein